MNVVARISYAVLSTLVGILFTFLRVYIRYFVQRRPRLKSKNFIAGDVLILLAMTGSLCYFGMDVKVLRRTLSLGEDRSTWDVMEKLEYGVLALKAGYVMSISYVTTMWSIKGSFICVYESCGVAMGKKAYRFMLFAAVYTVISCIIAVITNALSCWPLKRYWSLGADNCANAHYDQHVLVTTIAHLSSDTLILIMGLIVVRLSTSKMHRGDIYATLFIIGLALCTIATASVRLAIQLKILRKMREAAAHGMAGIASSERLMEKLSEWVAMASMAEINIALVAVSLPSMRVWARIRRDKREKKEGVQGMDLVVLGEIEREYGMGEGGRRETMSSWSERISIVRMLGKDFGDVREAEVKDYRVAR